MSKFKSESDASRVWDEAGDEEPEARPQRSRTRTRRESRPRTESRPPKNVRPEEVSERVWGLADQFLEMGAAHCGKRLPISKVEFSRRLANKINHDRTLVRLWRREGSFGPDFEDSNDFVSALVVRMFELFFAFLTHDQTKDLGRIQWILLDEEWDEWVYQAKTSLEVRWAKKYGTWEKPALPVAVFDPGCVGEPKPDEVHPDPVYGGKTYAEVEAAEAEYLKEHPLAPASGPGESDLDREARDRLHALRERVAAFRKTSGDTLANRHHDEEEGTK